MPWLLNCVYVLLLLAVSPVLLYRRLVLKKYRTGWREKLWGELPELPAGQTRIWFHAVSVGEVLLLRPVLKRLEEERPDCQIVISTTTSTGYEVAKTQFGRHTICYFPLDFSWAVQRALKRIRPSVVALVELELWPNFLLAARKQNVPVVLINGRISEHSYKGYRRIRPLMRRLLQALTRAAVQSETYAERLIKLGVPAERVYVTGSVKFDGVQTDRNNPKTQELKTCFGLQDHETVWVVGSTHAPEEEYALQSWLELKEEFPDLRLVLVPRHQERFEAVAELVERKGLPLLRRSRLKESGQSKSERTSGPAGSPLSSQKPVLLLDTLGELSGCWGLAQIAFVGGSLTSRGGQNMIEPAAYGAAVLFGPNTHNFRDVVELLLANQAARVVHSPQELTEQVRRLLRFPQEAQTMGNRARSIVLAQQGATEKTVQMLCHLLPTNSEQQRPAA